MWGRGNRTDDTVTLAELVEDGFAPSVGAIFDLLTERGFAIDVDQAGRLAVAETVAATLREERAEADRKAAQEAAEAARLAAEAAERRRAVRARREAERKAEAEQRQRHHDRIRKLEKVTGYNMVQLEQEMRRSIINAPNTGMSLDGRQAIEDRAFTLDEIEQWARNWVGEALFDEASR